MFASSNRKRFAYDLLIESVEKTVNKREYVKIPDNKQIENSLIQVLEEISDETEMAYSIYG